jgi:hypothetical protein
MHFVPPVLIHTINSAWRIFFHPRTPRKFIDASSAAAALTHVAPVSARATSRPMRRLAVSAHD